MAKEIVATSIVGDMVHVEYEDGTKEEKPLAKIKDRKAAYKHCETFTREKNGARKRF